MSCSRTTTQWRRWGSNPRPLGLESSTLQLSHCAPSRVHMKQKVTNTICQEHFLNYLTYKLPMLTHILPFLLWYHNKVCESLRQKPTVWLSTKTNEKKIVKEWPVLRHTICQHARLTIRWPSSLAIFFLLCLKND